MALYAKGTSDPPEVRNWTIHLVALVASLAALALGYDTAVIGGTMALESFRNAFDLDVDFSVSARDAAQANITSMFQVGAIFGALVTFPLADRDGRRWAIISACIVFIMGGIVMMSCSGDLELFVLGRLFCGFGIGSATLTVPVYIAEISPPSIRGRLVGMFEIAAQSGSMLGFWINYAVQRTIPGSKSSQWMIPMGVQLIPVGLLVVGICFCPESPRWLASQGDLQATEKALVRLRGLPADSNYVVNEMDQIRSQVNLDEFDGLSKWQMLRQMLRRLIAPGTRNRVAIGAFLMFLQSFTGTNVMTYFSVRIFETLGVAGTELTLLSTGIYGVTKTLGILVFAIWVVEGVGRRKALVWGAFLACLPMFYVGAFCEVADPQATAEAGQIQQSGWRYLAMVCVYLNAFIVCATWQGTTWTYAAEIFPPDIRMVCVALTTACTWLGSFVMSRAAPYMITHLGYGTFLMFGSFVFAMGIWAFFFVPETKGVTLEQMDRLFALPTHVTIWRQLRGKPLTEGEERIVSSRSLARRSAPSSIV